MGIFSTRLGVIVCSQFLAHPPRPCDLKPREAFRNRGKIWSTRSRLRFAPRGPLINYLVILIEAVSVGTSGNHFLGAWRIGPAPFKQRGLVPRDSSSLVVSSARLGCNWTIRPSSKCSAPAGIDSVADIRSETSSMGRSVVARNITLVLLMAIKVRIPLQVRIEMEAWSKQRTRCLTLRQGAVWGTTYSEVPQFCIALSRRAQRTPTAWLTGQQEGSCLLFVGCCRTKRFDTLDPAADKRDVGAGYPGKDDLVQPKYWPGFSGLWCVVFRFFLLAPISRTRAAGDVLGQSIARAPLMVPLRILLACTHIQY